MSIASRSSLNQILYALSDKARLDIVEQALESPGLVCAELRLDLAKSTISEHLKVLKRAGIIAVDAVGTWHHITVQLTELDRHYPDLLTTILRAHAQEKYANK